MRAEDKCNVSDDGGLWEVEDMDEETVLLALTGIGDDPETAQLVILPREQAYRLGHALKVVAHHLPLIHLPVRPDEVSVKNVTMRGGDVGIGTGEAT